MAIIVIPETVISISKTKIKNKIILISFCHSYGTSLITETSVTSSSRNVENYLTKAIIVTIFGGLAKPILI